MKLPYLQIALDFIEEKKAFYIAEVVAPLVEILEVGTPLLKATGIKIISILKKHFPSNLILADTKTMDVGALEAELVFNAGADIMTVCAAAPIETIQAAIKKAHELNKKVVVDFIGIKDKLNRAKEIVPLEPDYFNLHTAIDVQHIKGKFFNDLGLFKKHFSIPLSVAGGITPDDIGEIIQYNPDIIVVGGFITKAPDPKEAIMALKKEIKNVLS